MGGVIQDSASTSTLVALITARERSSDYALMHNGLQNSGAPLIVYTSAHAQLSQQRRSWPDSARTISAPSPPMHTMQCRPTRRRPSNRTCRRQHALRGDRHHRYHGRHGDRPAGSH